MSERKSVFQELDEQEGRKYNNNSYPDDHIPYLSEDDYKRFCQYKHNATKSFYEQFLINNISGKIEKILPEWWSPNMITMIGNGMVHIAGFICLCCGGFKYNEDPNYLSQGETHVLPSWVLYFSAFAVQWFSIFDTMDGARARRLNCGSPIGRVIDEGGDPMIYTWFACIIGYILKIQPGVLCLSYALLKGLPMYVQEMQYVLTGKLDMRIFGINFGPCDFEVLITIICIIAAKFGYHQMEQPLNQFVPTSMASYFQDDIRLNYALTSVFTFIMLMNIIVTIIRCLWYNFKLTCKMLVQPFMIMLPIISAAYLQTETYKNQFVVFHLFHSWVMNQAGYRLMISNMTKKSVEEIKIHNFGLVNVLAWIPNIVFIYCMDEQNSMNWELLATFCCMTTLLLIYYGQFMALSYQWLAYENGDRDWWSIEDLLEERRNNQNKKDKDL